MTMSVGPNYQLAFKHENCYHNLLGLKIKVCLSAMAIGGPGKVQKTQNAISNCIFALGPYISPMTNGLLTDLDLSIPPKLFFENLIDECVLTSAGLSYLLIIHF